MDSEFKLWNEMWKDQWEFHWKSTQEQHVQTVEGQIKLTNAEINKLKMTAVPNTVALTLIDLNKEIFPNIYHLLTILAVLPITTCKAELSFSSLR